MVVLFVQKLQPKPPVDNQNDSSAFSHHESQWPNCNGMFEMDRFSSSVLAAMTIFVFVFRVLGIELRMLNIYWTCSPISYEHICFGCPLLLDPHLTTHHSIISVCLWGIIKLLLHTVSSIREGSKNKKCANPYMPKFFFHIATTIVHPSAR